MQDRDYILKYQQGDFEAFGVLYESYIKKIFSYIFRKVSDREVAEDITSQVWMKALRALDTFDVDQKNMSFQAWIYRIAHNSIVDYFRTRKNTVDIDEIIEPGFSTDFLKHIDDRDKLSRIIAYISSLGNIEREICILRLWDELSYKEIAHLIGKSEDACKKSFSRSIKKIRAVFGCILTCIISIF